MDAASDGQPERPMVEAHADAVETTIADRVELRRRMRGVGLELREVSARQCLPVGR